MSDLPRSVAVQMRDRPGLMRVRGILRAVGSGLMQNNELTAMVDRTDSLV